MDPCLERCANQGCSGSCKKNCKAFLLDPHVSILIFIVPRSAEKACTWVTGVNEGLPGLYKQGVGLCGSRV